MAPSRSALPPRAHSVSHSLVLPTRRRWRNPNPSHRRPRARARARVNYRRRPTPLPPAPELSSRGPISWSIGSAPWLRLAFEAMAGQWTGSPMKVPSTGSSTTASGRRECRYCHVPLVRIQSKQSTTKDQWFLTCPYNIKVRILDIVDLTVSLYATLIDAFLCVG